MVNDIRITCFGVLDLIEAILKHSRTKYKLLHILKRPYKLTAVIFLDLLSFYYYYFRLHTGLHACAYVPPGSLAAGVDY